MFISNSAKLIFICAAMFALAGCVKAVTPSIKTAAGAGGAAARDEKKNDNHPENHDDDPRPFDVARDATLDVNAALGAARLSGKRVLLVLGGNWCHDSRGLAAKFEVPALAALIEQHYELVWVDVGRRDRNLHIPLRFGVPQIFGTPTVLILSSDGQLLNADSVHDWRMADSKPFDETFDYFQTFSDGGE